VVPSTRQQCNLVTSDQMRYVLTRWHAKCTPVIRLLFTDCL